MSLPIVTIDRFEGEYAFLSNFYEASALYDGILYPTAEHAYQAAKTEDPDEHEQIRNARTPGQAKRLGGQATLRPEWELAKVGVMRDVLISKFTRHPDLRQRLIDTGDAYLEEGNWWGDTFWGVCKGKGRNVLGLLLMDLRKSFIGLANK